MTECGPIRLVDCGKGPDSMIDHRVLNHMKDEEMVEKIVINDNCSEIY